MSKAAELAALIGSQTALSNRNLIINGAMQVNQRGDQTGVTTALYTLDRFQFLVNGMGTWDITQSSTAPAGFANSLKLDCTVADASPAAADYLALYYKFEGQDLQQLQKGTASAKSVTLSFYVRSNKTGTYNVNLNDNDNTRNLGGTYTINSADTWEYKTITYAGDTSGAFVDDNNLSLIIEWWLGSGTNFSSGTTPTAWETQDSADRNASGTVNLADNTANEWYITGVQFEVGETATPFEHRSYGDELNRCLRYFEKVYLNSYSCQLSAENANQAKGGVIRFSEKRANPSLTLPTPGTGSNELGYTNSVGSYVTQGSTFRSTQTKTQMSIFNNYADGFSGMTAGDNVMLYVNGNVEIDVKAEL